MRRGTAIAGLGMIAALYVLRAASLWSADDFGYLHDDTLYVSSARSLAEGRGYRIPSLPNAPAQTKYPVLYPWLLSILGSDLPELGQALERTFVLNVACGCLFLLGAFSLLRQLGAGKVGSLLVTLLCSLHPMMIDLARMPLSDLAFMAFAIWALVSASRDLEIDEDTGQRFRILSICTAATEHVGGGYPFHWRGRWERGSSWQRRSDALTNRPGLWPPVARFRWRRDCGGPQAAAIFRLRVSPTDTVRPCFSTPVTQVSGSCRCRTGPLLCPKFGSILSSCSRHRPCCVFSFQSGVFKVGFGKPSPSQPRSSL